MVTWAVGHLVALADPDEYDDRFKKWRMADLPIVPEQFKLVVRDERSKKQMNVVKRLLGRDDVDLVINACDAGREGELIFAYLYEKSGSRKPVQRLWLNSMTRAAIEAGFAELRPGAELASLEAAARSRSEADWIVGMNSTRAATIRLRSSFDGAVSLGRVQTPTLAILARREEEIRAFKPEPYWIVDAEFDPVTNGPRRYEGRYYAGSNPRMKTADEAKAVVAACTGQTGTITKLEKTERKERPPLLYDLTSLQRDANSRFGFSARRTLAAAQRLYEEHKALTYPRTNSRYLTQDMISEIKPIAQLVGERAEYAQASRYVLGLDVLPLGRVVSDAKVTDHHAIIPTRAESHPVDKMNDDDKRIYDLVVKRFLAIFHPEAVFENTRVETTVAEHVFRTRGKVMLVPGWRGVYGESADADPSGSGEDDEGREQQLPKLERDETVSVLEIGSEEKETKPPRRYSEGALLAAMETAGKLVDEEELREAMKDSGIGTPATRAAIIERLLAGRLHRARRAGAGRDREGSQRDPAARRAPAHEPGPDRRLGASARQDRDRRGFARGVHGRHRQVHRGHGRRARLQAQGCADSARQPRAVPGLRAGHHREPQGLLVLVARGPGLRVRDLEGQGGQAAADRGRSRADQDRPHRARRSPASRAARARASAPGSRCSRTRTASGGSSSTSRGRRRAPSRPKPRRRPTARWRRSTRSSPRPRDGRRAGRLLRPARGLRGARRGDRGGTAAGCALRAGTCSGPSSRRSSSSSPVAAASRTRSGSPAGPMRCH